MSESKYPPPVYGISVEDFRDVRTDRSERLDPLDWQPIETAPKDGKTRVDLWYQWREPKSDALRDGFRLTNMKWEGNGWAAAGQFARRDTMSYPTHWKRITKPKI